jgi:tight adherence protein C
MEYLIQMFTTALGDTDQTRWILSSAIGLASMLFLLGIALVIISAISPLRRRLRMASGNSSARRSAPSRLAEVMAPIAPAVLPRTSKERGHMQQKLVEAGYRGPQALMTFYSIKFVLSMIFLVGALLLVSVVPRFNTVQVFMVFLTAVFIGIAIPNFYLNRRLERRKKAILHAFPDALDLLVACTEAGLGLNAAIQRVSEELFVSHPTLAEELFIVNAEMRAGVNRSRALQNLSDRNGVEEIRGLVSMLNQSMRFGTSVADTLRVYSEEFRDKRMQRAEEQAAKLGTKMIFPMVFCMFPAFFIIAVGPAVIGVVHALRGSSLGSG